MVTVAARQGGEGQGAQSAGGGQNGVANPAGNPSRPGPEPIWRPQNPPNTETIAQQGIEPKHPPQYFEPNSDELETLNKVAQEEHVPLWYLKHTYFAESTNGYGKDTNWNIERPGKPYGWFGVVPAFAMKQFDMTKQELLTFEGSARAAALTYKRLLSLYGNDPCLAISAYNRGEGNLNNGGRKCFPDETTGYLNKVPSGICDEYIEYYANPYGIETPIDYKRDLKTGAKLKQKQTR